VTSKENGLPWKRSKKLAEQVGLNVAVKKRGKRKLKPKNHHGVKS